ncbi:hypothetical protein DV736_g1163, partial [Chaetothyriales sp. CBS 134916]
MASNSFTDSAQLKGRPASVSDVDENVTTISESRLIRKLDLRLLPALTLLFLLSFLDRSNVGNARVEGLTDDLGMTGDQYLNGLTLYFVGYVIFEVPCNIVMKLWTPRMWLPTLTLMWGIVSTLMGVTQSYGGFLAVRFFLGVSESGLFPGIVYYLSMWYKREERHFRVALFFSAAALAGAFGGILAWGIAHMNGVGRYSGWRWIFVLEGLLTVVVSLLAYFFIYNYPSTASFLTEDERDSIQTRLKADSDATQNESFTWTNFRKTFTDPKSDMNGVPRSSWDPLPFAIIGYILLLSDPRPGVSYLGTIFAATGIYPSVALVLAWPANNVSGQTKRAIANALQISIGNCGAIIGTQLYRTETAPRYFLGHSFALGYLAANMVVVTTLWWVLQMENKRRDALPTEIKEGEWEGDDDPRWRFHL